jgi:hypothetical protein
VRETCFLFWPTRDWLCGNTRFKCSAWPNFLNAVSKFSESRATKWRIFVPLDARNASVDSQTSYIYITFRLTTMARFYYVTTRNGALGGRITSGTHKFWSATAITRGALENFGSLVWHCQWHTPYDCAPLLSVARVGRDKLIY